MSCGRLTQTSTLGALFFRLWVAQGAFEADPPAPRMVSMGGSATCVRGDGWAALVNPSTLRLTSSWSLEAGFSPGLFGMPELAQAGCTAILPFTHVTAGGVVLTLGGPLYREYRILGAAAADVSDRCHAGLGLNLYGVTISGYGHAVAFGLDAGLVYRVTAEVLLGASLVNLNGAALGESQSPIPQVMTLAVSYEPEAALLVAASLVKDLEFPPTLRMGAEYRPVRSFALRVGATHNPSVASAGAGVCVGSLRFDYAVTSHPVLGLTHRMSVTVSGGE